VAGWMPSKGQAGAKCAQGRCKRGTTIKAARQGPHLTPCSLPRGRTCAQGKYRESKQKALLDYISGLRGHSCPRNGASRCATEKLRASPRCTSPPKWAQLSRGFCPSLDERLGVTSGWPVSKPGRMRPAGPAGDFAGFGIGGCSG
jgi:hypothetical protein